MYNEKLLMMDRGTVQNMYSSYQNKFVKLVHLVGFIIKKFIMMHGHMNVKDGLELCLHVLIRSLSDQSIGSIIHII